MKILVIGSRGNMGGRYRAILRYLGVEVVERDIGLNDSGKIFEMDFDKAIIASPTDNHFQHCLDVSVTEKPWLCEKPVTKNIIEMEGLRNLRNGYMVCNWKYASPDLSPDDISYDFYNTGKDGAVWDCIQLVYLAQKRIKIKTDSPYFLCYIDNKPVTLDMVCQSYIGMVTDFVIGAYKNLWTMEDAYKATEKVLTWKGIDYVDSNSSPHK